MRRLAPVGLLISLSSVAPIVRATPNAVVEVPVSFSVVNTNTSRTAAACTPDGEPYTVRGVLAAPAGALEEGPDNAATLYLHGSGDGSTWNFTAVPDTDHIAEMAQLGHVSVFLHMLGYGESDAIDGSSMCFGAWADVAHQVVQHLRAGTYDAAGTPAPAFDRVVLAGHSAGGVAVSLYSISYDDIDAMVIAGWADVPAFSFAPLYGALARFGSACVRGGRAKEGAGAWARLFSTPDLDALLNDLDPAVEHAFVDLYEDDPCGVLKDTGPFLASTLAAAPLWVTIPVLLVYGDHDIFLPGAAEIQRAHYLASKDVTLEVMANTGHNMMMGRTAPEFRGLLSSWLETRGF